MPALDMSVPDGTVAVVVLHHGDAGELVARYAEARERVPAPREQVAEVLFELALELQKQANELVEGADR